MKYLLYMLLVLFIGAAIAVIIVTGGSQCPRNIFIPYLTPGIRSGEVNSV